MNFLYALLLESNQSLVTSVENCGHWNQGVVINSDPRVYKYNGVPSVRYSINKCIHDDTVENGDRWW